MSEKAAFQSVHVFLAFLGSTVALYFVFFSWKLVVIGQLFTREYFSQRKNYNVLGTKYVHNLAVAVGLEKIVIV